MEINRVGPTSIAGLREAYGIKDTGRAEGKPAAGQSFANMLSDLSQSEAGTDNLVAKLAAGENVELHDVMIGLEETDVQFRVALAIRDKLVEAYREVMRMQV